MSSGSNRPHALLRYVLLAAFLAGQLLAAGRAQPASNVGPAMPQSVLRVCSDPNNLPFSNHQQKGFENDLARMVAHDLGMTLSYTWAPQRSRFFQKTLLAGICDVAMGLPSRMDLASTTVPYYRSTYFFVARRDRISNICSFDDPRVRQMRIGVHSIGDDNANLPPATALADRGLARNVVGYSIYGNLAQPNPPAELIRAVADGDVDVAVAWGPLAGYFAQRSAAPLKLTPVCPSPSDAALGFAFDISMGVRHGDTRLLDRLNAEIERRRPEIGQLLQKYGIPTLPLDPARPAGKAAVTAKSE